MMEFIEGIILVAGGTFSLVLFLLGLNFLRADKNAYDMNRELTGGFFKALFGRTKTFHEGTRDYRVKAGLAVYIRKNEWVEQGTLSNESISSILR